MYTCTCTVHVRTGNLPLEQQLVVSAQYPPLPLSQLDRSLSQHASYLETVRAISAQADASAFVVGQNVSVKVYPPPRAEFKAPDLPVPKLPDAAPVDLVGDTLFNYNLVPRLPPPTGIK